MEEGKENKKLNDKPERRIDKKIIIILVIVAIVAVVIVGFLFQRKDDRQERQEIEQQQIEANKNYKELEDGTLLNISEKILEDKNIGTLIISNTQITRKNNITTITADVKNTGKEEDGNFSVDLTFTEKDGDKITNMTGYIQKLKPGETTELIISGSYDYVDAYDFKIVKK